MKYIVLIVFLISSLDIFADNNARININLYNSLTPQKKIILGFGVNELAGDSIDPHLGEKSYPPFPPSFAAVLEFVDSTKFNQDGTKYYDLIWTNLDLRSVPNDKDTWQNIYKLVINWIGAPTVIIEWNNAMIPELIDSVYIKDVLGGIVINQDMKKTNKLILDNDAIDKLYFYVYYSKKNTSIDDLLSNDVLLYPNPFNDILMVDESINFDEFIIYDINGSLIMKDKNIENVSLLTSGTYFIELKLANRIISRQLITKI